MYTMMIARYGEIAIKGKNRSEFEKRLVQNMQALLKPLEKPIKVARGSGRILVHVGENSYDEVLEILRWVPGIVSLSPVIECESQLETIKEKATQTVLRAIHGATTFKVEARRADKRFPITSPELAKELGAHLLKDVPDLKVDVHDPELTLYCEVRENSTYVYSEIVPGPGGLPVGTSGKALLLLSGGIDSPVAGWMAMKRGLEIEAIHFHSFPFTSERARQKVEDLAQILARYGGRVRLHVVPFTEAQKGIRQHCPEELSITVMRRIMLRIAEAIADKNKIKALVTGESLGQVASQTLESMYTINHVTVMPILRPLITTDKVDIVRVAKTIGTYETSILPFEDCCTIFLPKNPRTKPKLREAEWAEKDLDIEALVADAVARTELMQFYR